MKTLWPERTALGKGFWREGDSKKEELGKASGGEWSEREQGLR